MAKGEILIELSKDQLDKIRNLSQPLTYWFSNAITVPEQYCMTDQCKLLLCACEIKITSCKLKTLLDKIASEYDPPNGQSTHIVQSLLRQVVLLKYDINVEERKFFFKYWIDDNNISGMQLLSVAYIIGLSLEQANLLSNGSIERVKHWFAQHKIESNRMRAWLPRYLELSGMEDLANQTARSLMNERSKNGSWPGGFGLNAAMLYALACAEKMNKRILSPTIMYLANRLALGISNDTSTEANTLKAFKRLTIFSENDFDRIRSILAKASRIFISHSSADIEFIKRISEDLNKHGMTVWLNENNIFPGDQIITVLEKAIAECDYLIIALSKKSLKSNWVKEEMHLAMTMSFNRGEMKIIPVLIDIDESEIPGFLKTRHFADFRLDYASGMKKLIQSFI